MLNSNERRPGRPPLEPGQRSATVRVTLPPSLHDHACRIALRHGISVAEVHRRALKQYDEDEGEE